jgi:N-acetyl-alpha-D-muramate 1-phosphate uridylyltransferase
MLPAAILAGGLATRLRPLTDRTPKALLNVAGRPFIFRQLEFLREQGVNRVVLCVGHLGEQIREAVGGSASGLSIQYSFDGPLLLGTGGALRRALPLLGAEFFVLNGDSYTPCALSRVQAAFEAAHRPALMTILRNDSRWDRSNVLVKKGELIEYDKDSVRPDMRHIDFGVSVFSRDVFQKFDESTVVDLAVINRQLSLRGQLAIFEVADRFYEIGSLQGLKETEDYLRRKPVAA